MTRTERARALGRAGEEYAVAYLESLGWRVIDRNWRCRHGEIDVVALDEHESLVFVEVKTRAGMGYGSPLESITWRKANTLRSLAIAWLQENRMRVARIRVDAVGIVKRPGQAPQLRHMRNIEPW